MPYSFALQLLKPVASVYYPMNQRTVLAFDQPPGPLEIMRIDVFKESRC